MADLMQDATPQPNADLSLIEAELQNELRSMFELDTQTYLQTYETISQQLTQESWATNIQELYRAIHTIKGGAVTVGATSVLATTTALEEILSDLRYLQSAPPLQDGVLIGILGEAGEVVSGSLLIGSEEEDGGESALNSALARLNILHKQVSDRFLTDIDERQQLCQDFSNQGFDLMVLDLEMALEQLTEGDSVSPQLVETSAQIFTDLESVGKDLDIGPNWQLLLQPLFELLIESDGDVWRSRCCCYLKLLKACALEGGKLSESAQQQLESDGFSSTLMEDISHVSDTSVTQAPSAESLEASEALNFLLEDMEFPEIESDSEPSVSLEMEALLDADPDEFQRIITASQDATVTQELEPSASSDGSSSELFPLEVQLPELDDLHADNLEKDNSLLKQALQQIESLPELVSDQETVDDSAIPEDFLDALSTITSQIESSDEIPEWLITAPNQPADMPQAIQPDAIASSRKQSIPKIPVPLDRLDRSASALVDILLSARATQGQYRTLQNQVAQIVQLSQDNASYITQLRQMQDDYAMLQSLQTQSQEGVQLEGYRSGYTAINRLLENSLRLSEIGAEAAAIAQVAKQEFNQLNLNIKTLQINVEESRLISFKSVAFRLRAIIRDLINRIGKPVELVIEGESQKLDAGTIQILEPALLHLIRNAYDHGIETEEVRLNHGKPPVAKITLSLKRQGSFYHLSIADDGGGIDRAHIAQMAQEKGLTSFDTATDTQLLDVICQPGFSSQSTVSEVSGRGVGMDVVSHQIQSVDGSLKLFTQLGQGTQFDIKIPVPHLLVPCLVVRSGQQHLAIPTDSIQTMRLWNQSCVHSTQPFHNMMPWEREFDGVVEPMMPILNYWQEQLQPPEIDPSKMETAICLRIIDQRHGSKALWLVIDDLVEELDLLITALPKPLQSPIGMLGMSPLPTGEMVPVLEAGAIAQALLSPDVESPHLSLRLAENTPTQATQIDQNTNLILVVDDAALLRRRLEVSLINYGYEVHCCRDGLEAWNWIQANPMPGLMITDIEMPQMDGFTLVDHCRQSGRNFPILVSSSRLSEEWSQEAQRVGANDYLTKGFSTNDLIERVSGLLDTATLA